MSNKNSSLNIYSPIADIMSGLMMVFLFIAVAFMLNQQAITKEIKKKNKAMRDIAEVAEQSREQINQELRQTFSADFLRWDAELLADNTVRFKAPEVLFKPGKADLTLRYKEIMDSFFPRYVQILFKYKTELEAIRIEGHTSNDWGIVTDEQERFLLNMGLSQLRALETLSYGFRQIKDKKLANWLQMVLMGNGRSFGQLVHDKTGMINADASRRVEFKLVTRAEDRLYRILDQSRNSLTIQHPSSTKTNNQPVMKSSG